jgi:hypothetical protein
MHKILFYNKFIICLYIFRALCARHQEVKIVLYSIWYRHTCRWPSGAQVTVSYSSCFSTAGDWVACCCLCAQLSVSRPRHLWSLDAQKNACHRKYLRHGTLNPTHFVGLVLDEGVHRTATYRCDDTRCFISSGVTRNFVRGAVQQIQLRTEDRENGDLGAVAP